jgi:serine/threonine protein kinase
MTSAPAINADVCPQCGLALSHAVGTGGLCPRCLIAMAVEHLSTVDHPALGRFGSVGAAPDIETLNSQLPTYEFCELLGRGGAGWVYRALQRSLHRPVAIKILHGGTSGITDAAQRFAREAQILARLKHPRIVTVHDYGALPDSQYLVMEYVSGPTLRDLLRGGSLRGDAVRIADQICEAVEYAHAMGVMHRDLKPENVLFESVDRLDTLKVADFGISRLIGDTEPGFHQTQTGFVVGTPFYAAPEQMVSKQAVGTRADIYSIGVMLYEMLTDQLPRGRFPAPSQLANVPAGIDAVVLRCLESDPERRYADVASLRVALNQAASGSASRRRLVALSVLTAAAAAFCVWALATYFGRDRADQPSPNNTQVATESKQPKSPSTTPLVTAEPQPNEAASTNPPAGTNPLPPASRTIRDDEYFEITAAKAYGFTPSYVEFRIDADRVYKDFKPKEDAGLVWVIQTAGVHRVDIPFQLPEGKHQFTIAESRHLDAGDRWPIEVYIAERSHTPSVTIRRLSNIVRIESRDVERGPAPSTGNSSQRYIVKKPTGQQ